MNTNNSYRKILSALYYNGKEVNVRDCQTYELLGFQSVIDMSRPVITIPERRLGYKFMAAEAAWILSGDNRVSTIGPYAKKIKEFSDDEIFFFGAYGPQVRDQMPHVIRALTHDNYSRQAVISIWRRSPPTSKDIPCTLSLQFMIRDGLLHCHATMRSSDVWLGVPYDWFNFSMISLYIALLLHSKGIAVELGQLYFTAASQHLYTCNMDGLENVMTNSLQETVIKPSPLFSVNQFVGYEDLVTCLHAAANHWSHMWLPVCIKELMLFGEKNEDN